ncbi:MAG: metal ABC transporter solute-binding protein, Zn/Mn family [Aeromonas sp.]
MQTRGLVPLADSSLASTHNAYGYLQQEFGIGIDTVIEPAHGVEPNAAQLQQIIARIKAANIQVLFTELDMDNRYVELIQSATCIKIYHFSHMTFGDYDHRSGEPRDGAQPQYPGQGALFGGVGELMGPSIVLQVLALSLNRVYILQPIDGLFEPGQLHAIVGPNGAGKSSLLKCVLGLRPHSGEVYREWPGALGSVAYVPQQSQFEPSLPITINEFLLATFSRRPLWLPMTAAAKARIDALLEQVGLSGKGQLRLGQLSGGERQRLLLAQGLDQQSQLWCLDEPMTGLDQAGQKMVTHLLQRLRQIRIVPIDVANELASAGARVTLRPDGEGDYFWLDFGNLTLMGNVAARDLARVWPDRSEQIERNRQRLLRAIAHTAMAFDEVLLAHNVSSLAVVDPRLMPLAQALGLPLVADLVLASRPVKGRD